MSAYAQTLTVLSRRRTSTRTEVVSFRCAAWVQDNHEHVEPEARARTFCIALLKSAARLYGTRAMAFYSIAQHSTS